MKSMPSHQRQRGAALMAMLAVLIVGATWLTVAALSNATNRTAQDRVQNAQVLQQAKSALMGWVAHQAAMTGENDPGRLPCPELAANIGTANQGLAAATCTLPAVGRLPWRTLGLDQLRDAAGEPLWYVVSPGWTLDGIVANTMINSNTPGQLTLDATGDLVALVIAPGAPLSVTDGTCAPRHQARSAPGNILDYLECVNVDGVPNVFASSGPAGSFNDQVLALSATELMPYIESAVAARFAREFGTSMRYCGTAPWPACTASAKFPFAADFTDPTAPAFSFQGTLDKREGLLPLSFSAAAATCVPDSPTAPFCGPPALCNPAIAGSRCLPNLVTYRNNPVIAQSGTGGNADLVNYDCSASTTTTISCTLNARHSVLAAQSSRWFDFTIDVTSDNVGMAVRRLNTAVQMTGVSTAANPPYGYAVNSAQINADGSATVRLTARVSAPGGGVLGLLENIGDLVCGLGTLLLQLANNCNSHTITLAYMWLDEPMLYSTNATVAWFYRNGWHQNMYYAVSQDNAPSGGGSCSAATCLSVSGASTTNTHRAALVTPGRALTGQTRPPALVTDWLEGINADANASYGVRDPALINNRTINDRVVVIDSN